jgi:hypothetical protein
MTLICWVFVLFIVKHFVCDFPLQAFPYMYRNKGTYGHPGGYLHAGVHAVGTFAIMAWFIAPVAAMIAAILDFWIHYHIDWAKMYINKKTGWKPDNSEKFWIALGVDQMLHYLTYVLIIFLFIV